MFMLSILGRALTGFWRLLVGMAIGVVLYVWMFFEHKEIWLSVQDKAGEFMKWAVSFPQLAEYSHWNALLNLDDKLAFALYIMVGRFIWLMVEAAIIKLPYWLYQRNKQGIAHTEVAPGAGA